MTTELWLYFKLQSEACFGRGDGVPGVVDIEVNHDRYGLPFLGGRTLKGLLHAEATEIVEALERYDQEQFRQWAGVANSLFGRPGSQSDSEGKLHIGDARLPDDLRSQVAASFANNTQLRRQTVLETMTTVRRQTAIDPQTGAPQAETLRAVRVIFSDTHFIARLLFRSPATDDELSFLAACVKAFRRAGSNKTRGYGRLSGELLAEPEGEAITERHFQRFREAL